MSSQEKSGNAFTDQYLEAIREEDEPPHAAEVEFGGPWQTLVRKDGGFGVYRAWEGPDRGDEPFLVTPDVTVAQIFQLALQISAREPLFFCQWEREELGFPVVSEGKAVAFLQLFYEDAMPAAHTLSCLARSPQALALLLEIAGPLAQEMVGRMLSQRLDAEPSKAAIH